MIPQKKVTMMIIVMKKKNENQLQILWLWIFKGKMVRQMLQKPYRGFIRKWETCGAAKINKSIASCERKASKHTQIIEKIFHSRRNKGI